MDSSFDTEFCADKAKVIGLILAGGASSRMGQDKAQLCIDQRSLLSIANSRMLDSGADKVIVSSNHLDDGLADKILGCGPMSAIHSIVNEPWINQYQGMLVLPVDMPLIQSSQLQILSQHGRVTQRSCCFEQSYLPAYIALTPTLLDVVEQQMKIGDYAIKRLLAKLNYEQLITSSGSGETTTMTPFYNINTPEQWQRFISKSQPQAYPKTSSKEES